MAGGCGPGERAGAEEGLVVGVRVEGDEGPEGHRGILAAGSGEYRDLVPVDRPLRIGLVSDCYVPRLGGIEMQVHDLARHLQGPATRSW